VNQWGIPDSDPPESSRRRTENPDFCAVRYAVPLLRRVVTCSFTKPDQGETDKHHDELSPQKTEDSD